MKEYGEQIDLSTHRKNYVRVVGRNGDTTEQDLQGIRIDSDISGTLKFAVSGYKFSEIHGYWKIG